MKFFKKIHFDTIFAFILLGLITFHFWKLYQENLANNVFYQDNKAFILLASIYVLVFLTLYILRDFNLTNALFASSNSLMIVSFYLAGLGYLRPYYEQYWSLASSLVIFSPIGIYLSAKTLTVSDNKLKFFNYETYFLLAVNFVYSLNNLLVYEEINTSLNIIYGDTIVIVTLIFSVYEFIILKRRYPIIGKYLTIIIVGIIISLLGIFVNLIYVYLGMIDVFSKISGYRGEFRQVFSLIAIIMISVALISLPRKEILLNNSIYSKWTDGYPMLPFYQQLTQIVIKLTNNHHSALIPEKSQSPLQNQVIETKISDEVLLDEGMTTNLDKIETQLDETTTEEISKSLKNILSGLSIMILIELAKQAPKPKLVSELVSSLQKPPSTISYQLKKLTNSGVISRKDSLVDSRRSEIKLTHKGVRVLIYLHHQLTEQLRLDRIDLLKIFCIKPEPKLTTFNNDPI